LPSGRCSTAQTDIGAILRESLETKGQALACASGYLPSWKGGQ
jgi:hypothetical protein